MITKRRITSIVVSCGVLHEVCWDTNRLYYLFLVFENYKYEVTFSCTKICTIYRILFYLFTSIYVSIYKSDFVKWRLEQSGQAKTSAQLFISYDQVSPNYLTCKYEKYDISYWFRVGEELLGKEFFPPEGEVVSENTFNGYSRAQAIHT